MGFSDAFQSRYEVLRTLGKGGMGQVLLARARTDGRSVAIKVIAAGSFGDAESRGRFLMEARVTARLTHPAIVGVIEHGEDGDSLFLVLELVSGGDLDGRIKKGPLSPAEFWQVACPVMDGIAFAHGQGVLHRDIKGANILLDETGDPRIADFGIAKDLAGTGFRTATGLIMGTPSYMAPELARGEKASAASDQYALGVLMFEMLAGVRPFVAEEPLAMLRLHIEAPVPSFGSLRRDVPPALGAAVRRALEKNPAARFPDVAALGAELARIRAEVGTVWRRQALSGKAAVTGAAPVMTGATSGVTGAASGVTGTSGSMPRPRTTGRQRITSTLAVPASGAAASAGGARRMAWAAAVTLLVLAGAVSVHRGRVRPAAGVGSSPSVQDSGPGSPAPSLAPEIRIRQERSVNGVRFSWEPSREASRAVLTCPGAEAVGVTTRSVELASIGRDGREGRLVLTFPDTVTVTHTVKIDDINPRAVVQGLQELRGIDLSPVSGRKAKKQAPPELAIYRKFSTAMMPNRTYDERHPADPQRLKARATLAAASSGLRAALVRQRDRGLPELLRRASLLLDDGAPSNPEKFALLDELHALAELHCFAELHEVLDGPNEPMRCLYALPPGALATRRVTVLEGRSDYRRSRWKLRLVESRTVKEKDRKPVEAIDWLDRFAEEGAVQYARTAIEFYNRMNGAKLARAADWKKESFKAVAIEFVEDQPPFFLSTKAVVSDPARFEMLTAEDTESRDHLPPELVVALAAKMGPRVHVDVSPQRVTHREGTLCFRWPPGYLGRYSDGVMLDVRAVLAWELPSGTFHNGSGSNVELSVHGTPGEGSYASTAPTNPWESRIETLLFWMHHPGKGIPK